MTLEQMFVGWFYYGIIYMGLSVLATVMINKVTTRWYVAPLLINALAIGVLLLAIRLNVVKESEQSFALYFIYMPIVFASFSFNGVKALFLWMKNRALKNS